MSDKVLEAINIFKSFETPDGKLEILKGIDISIKRGEKILIQGPSGSGKTTLLMILSLLDIPDKGQIFYHGEKINYRDEKFLSRLRNKKFGFIFQFYNLINELTSLENVMIPLLIRGEDIRKAREKAEKILDKVELLHRKNSFPFELSGGEEQRVAIARALINEPEIIFADEPTGNLDERNAEVVINILFDLVVQNGVSLIMVSHNPYWTKYFDMVYYLKDGKLHLR